MVITEPKVITEITRKPFGFGFQTLPAPHLPFLFYREYNLEGAGKRLDGAYTKVSQGINIYKHILNVYN